MLVQLHKHMKWIMWTIVVVITVAFLFFGIYPANVGGRTAAKVNGDIITLEEWSRVYQNLADTYRSQLKDKFNEAFEKRLKAQALQELVVDKLMAQEAVRLGIKVSDEELQSEIMKISVFSEGGKFDKNIYERILNRVNMTPAAFEASEREQLLRQKLERLLKDSVMVTEPELAAAYKQENPKASAKAFEKNKESFRETYLAEKQRDELTAYVRNIQARSEITINEKSLKL
jgi:peptidyl-prolyl cis-trans isomerase D